MRILSNSVKFCAGRPILPAYKFSATVAVTYSTYRLGHGLPTIFWRLKICLPTFRPMSIVAKRLGGSRYHLVRRYASAQATLGTHLPHAKGHSAPPTFRPTALTRIFASPHFTRNPYCRRGSVRRAALVAILPDNYHPSNLHCVNLNL